jgi:hypothetical protein
MSELTPLREAVDTLAGRSPSPDFGELQRRATRRGRRRIVMVAAAATAALIAGSLLTLTDHDQHHQTLPAQPPKPSSNPEKIIADGDISGYDADESGAVLTVWTNCQNDNDTNCGRAWRLGTGARPQAIGIVPGGQPAVHAGKNGFVLSHPIGDEISLRIGLDGTVTSLPKCRHHNPPVEPGRLAWDSTMVLDTAGVFCPTRFGGGDWYDDGIEARPLAFSGGFTGDGRLWALVSNGEQQLPSTPAQTIGMFDGSRWHYHDLAQKGLAADSQVAAAGTNVVVLSKRGISVTTDDGANWHEVTDPRVVDRDLPFLADARCCISVAFAGSSTLYVADPRGDLWRSTDLTTFHKIDGPGVLSGLKPAGNGVLALVNDTNDLVRITADGRVERLLVR